jgi:zinc transport system permease protein
MMVDLFSMFEYAFFQRAFIGGLCAALLCSILGVFIVLRRAALIGEGVAHLSFGGIALGLFLSIYPLDTALVLSLLGILAISYLQRKRIVYSEMAIGIMIAFGLGLGAVLASMAGGFSVDLFSYLFGSILTISSGDLDLILVLSAVVLVFVAVFYKELMYMTFDEQGARLSGIPVGVIDLAFNIVLAFTVVVSIKIVGSLLVSALLIIPASSAMQLSKSFRGTVGISIVLGTIAVLLGLVTSFLYDIATGGAIVLISIGLFLLSVALKKIIGAEQTAPEDG